MKKLHSAVEEYKFYKSYFAGKYTVNLVYLSREEYGIHGYKVFFGFHNDYLTNRLKAEIIL